MPGQTTERACETYVEEILLTCGGCKAGTVTGRIYVRSVQR